MATHRSRPHRYNRNGEIIPPLPPQALKARPIRADRIAIDPLDAEATRRDTQRRIANLDTLEAGQAVTMLRAIIGDAVTLTNEQSEAIARQAHLLNQSRPSLRRRVVELFRYTARTEPMPAASVLLNVAKAIDESRRERIAR